jgi:hypothetical protein
MNFAKVDADMGFPVFDGRRPKNSESRLQESLTTRLTLRPRDAPRDTGHEGDDQDDPDDHVNRSISAVAPRVEKPLMCKAPHDLPSRCKLVAANHIIAGYARGDRKFSTLPSAREN